MDLGNGWRADICGDRHGGAMSILKRNPVLFFTAAALALLLLCAAGAQVFFHYSDTSRVGTVSNVSVGFAGGTAESARVVVVSGAGNITARAGIRNVPEAGDTIAVTEKDGEWVVPSSASLRAGLTQPYTHGLLGLLGAGVAIAGVGLLVSSTRRETDSGISQSAEGEHAEDSEESSSSLTQTS